MMAVKAGLLVGRSGKGFAGPRRSPLAARGRPRDLEGLGALTHQARRPNSACRRSFACLTACHEQTLVVRRQPDAVDRLLAQQRRADCDAQLAIVGASTKVAAAFYELRELCGVCAATPHAINWSSTRRRSSARCLGTQTSKRRATASSMF